MQTKINELFITIRISEDNKDLVFLSYEILLNGVKYLMDDYIFSDNLDQLYDYQNKLQQIEFLILIVHRCKVIPTNLFLICLANDLINNQQYSQLKIIDEQQQQLVKLIQSFQIDSINQSYQLLDKIQLELKRFSLLAQIIMVDSITRLEQRVSFMQECVSFFQKYKVNDNTQLFQYIKEKLLFALNDLYRLQSSLLRKDLCQQTLLQLQNESIYLQQNNNITSKIIQLQLDFNQADYIHSIQNKVQINLQNVYNILKSMKLYDIYNAKEQLIQIPVMYQTDNLLSFQINDNLTKIMQLIFGCFQLQENFHLGEMLQEKKIFFDHVTNLQIRYTYHICLSLSTQNKDEALQNSLKAYQLSLEINDFNDIIEIFINTQLLYIETDNTFEGLKFSTQFLEHFGEEKIKHSNKAEFKQIQDNMTYMMVKQKINE